MATPPQTNSLHPLSSASIEETRRAAERYRLLFDNNPVPMWVYDIGTVR